VLYRERGVAVVVDGLDEVSGSAAEAIVRDAQILVSSNLSSTVLATSRPDVIADSGLTMIPVQGLEEHDIRAIVEALTDDNVAVYRWPPALRESAKRPFFALAAAVATSSGVQVDGTAGLIRTVVERALQRGNDQRLLESSQLFELLTDLAVELTDRSVDRWTLTVDRKRQALATRLVHTNTSGSIEFSLPIFQQWFAAQALLKGPDIIDVKVIAAESFDQWRWSIAIAVSAARPSVVDHLMAALLSLNPGAGAWVLAQVVSNSFQSQYEAEDESLMPPRISLAAEGWTKSLGAASGLYFGGQQPSAAIKVGFRKSSENMVDLAIYSTVVDQMQVVQIQSGQGAFNPNPEWSTYFQALTGVGPIWPWLAFRDCLARKTGDILGAAIPLGDNEGLHAEELRYHRCRTIVSQSGIFHSPMQVSDLVEKIDELLAAVPDVDSEHLTVFNWPRLSMQSDELRELKQWLIDSGRLDIVRPLPVPDIPPEQGGGWVWSFYSQQRLLEFVVECYANAYDIYDELTRNEFSAFSWSLAGTAYQPIGLVGILVLPPVETLSIGPTLRYQELPVNLVAAEIEKYPDRFLRSSNGRVACAIDTSESVPVREYGSELLADWLAANRNPTPFRRLTSGWTALDTQGNRPATAIAHDWLFDDLAALKLTSGPRRKMKYNN
jgi:hypothetical protein